MRPGVGAIIAVCLIAAMGPDAGADVGTGSSRVLVLFSERSSIPSGAMFWQGLHESLTSTQTVQIEEQHLDASQRADDAQLAGMADWLQSQYHKRSIAVVVAFGEPASDFAVRYGKSIWPGARFVHANIAIALAGPALERGDPVIARGNNSGRIAEEALKIFPGTRQLWLIGGSTVLDRRFLDQVTTDLAPLGNRIQVKELAGLSWEEILAQVKHMPADAIAFPPTVFGDANGRTFDVAEAALEIARHANRPVFVASNWAVESGAFGGYVRNFDEAGRIAGRTIVRLLAGARDVPPVQVISGRWMFNDGQLHRWGISESRLPPGSLVVKREEVVWHRYRWPIVVIVALMVMQAAIISTLLIQGRRRHRVEVALRASEETARASVLQVRDLAGRLISARENERACIARDLHDDIGQRVASVSIGLSRLKPHFADSSSRAVQSLSDLEQQVMHLSVDLRHLSHDLHPTTLVHLGLLEALQERCDEFREESGVPVRLEVSQSWRHVSDAVALCLYRVAQEALHNVATHARAQGATVSLDFREGQLMMRVADDGLGFEPDVISGRRGLGLVSLGERVRMLGGVLHVNSSPGEGTCVAVNLPAGE